MWKRKLKSLRTSFARTCRFTIFISIQTLSTRTSQVKEVIPQSDWLRACQFLQNGATINSNRVLHSISLQNMKHYLLCPSYRVHLTAPTRGNVRLEILHLEGMEVNEKWEQ